MIPCSAGLEGGGGRWQVAGVFRFFFFLFFFFLFFFPPLLSPLVNLHLGNLRLSPLFPVCVWQEFLPDGRSIDLCYVWDHWQCLWSPRLFHECHGHWSRRIRTRLVILLQINHFFMIFFSFSFLFFFLFSLFFYFLFYFSFSFFLNFIIIFYYYFLLFLLFLF